MAEPTSEQTAEPMAGPKSEPMAEPTAEQTAEPMAGPKSEPMAEPTSELTTEQGRRSGSLADVGKNGGENGGDENLPSELPFSATIHMCKKYIAQSMIMLS